MAARWRAYSMASANPRKRWILQHQGRRRSADLATQKIKEGDPSWSAAQATAPDHRH